MRRFILIAGFVLASAAAQAGDRSLSLGSETTTVAAPAKAAEGSKTAEVPPAAEAPKAEAPKYIERPAVVEPKAEAPRPDTIKTQAAKIEQPAAEPAKPVARKTASTSKSEKPRRQRHWNEARIIRELHRHGIYW
jgi:hypothetical protein